LDTRFEANQPPMNTDEHSAACSRNPKKHTESQHTKKNILDTDFH